MLHCGCPVQLKLAIPEPQWANEQLALNVQISHTLKTGQRTAAGTWKVLESYRRPPSRSCQAGRPGSSKQAVTGKRKGCIKGTLTQSACDAFAEWPHQFAHLTVYLVQRGQNILYKGALGHLVRLRPLELAGGGLEVDVAPQPACKLLGVHCSPIHITVQLSEGQQGERPPRLTCSKGHIALDGVNLHQQTRQLSCIVDVENV